MSNGPTRYSAATPTSSTTALGTLAPGQALPINFSGATDPAGNPSTFSAGGWICWNQQQGVTIFNACDELLIGIQASGQLSVTLSGGQIVSDVAITDQNWHYVMVTYLPSTNPNVTGLLSLYLDGLNILSQEVSATNDTGETSYVLGPEGQALQFAAWSLWSVALASDIVGAPQWGDPTLGTQAADGLVAAFDFADGAAQDLSPNNYPVTVSQLSWFSGCLSLTGGIATVQTPGLNPGGGSNGATAPFSVLGWALVPLPGSSVTFPLLKNGNADTQFLLQLTTDSASNLSAGCAWGSFQYSTPVAAGEWAHLALTWDGQTATFYLNGVVAQTMAFQPTPIDPPYLTIGAWNSGGPWYVQGVSLWSICLQQDDIDSYLLGADPDGAEGCVASFALVTDAGDSVNGNALSLSGCEMTTLTTAMTSAEPVAARTVAPVTLDGPRLLLAADLKRIAQQHGIDVDSPVSAADTTGPQYGGLAEWFDGIAKQLSPSAAARLKGEFLRDVRIGMALRQQGIKAGSLSMTVEGADTVGYYYTEAGPQEVYRLSNVALTPMQQWGFTITFDVISLVASMFGVVTSAAKVTKAIGLLEPEINSIVSAVQASYQVSDAVLTKAKKITMAVLVVIYASNAGYSVFKKIVVGSWWSLAFTVANIVLTVAALIATDGAALIIRIVQMGVGLGQLVYDLLQMPTSQVAAAARAVGRA